MSGFESECAGALLAEAEARRSRPIFAAAFAWSGLLSAVLALLYGVAPPVRPSAPYTTGFTLLVVMFAAGYLAFQRVSPRWVRPVAFAGALGCVTFALWFVWYSQEPRQTVMIYITVFAVSALVLTLREVIVLGGYAALVWAVLAADFPVREQIHWGVNMASTLLLSAVSSWTRMRLTDEAVRESAAAQAAHARVTEQAAALEAQAEALAQARDEAVAAVAAKTRFLANASHEIRTPLNGVLGLAELLRLTEQTEEQEGLTESILGCGVHLQRLLDELIELGRGGGGLSLALQPCDLTALVDQVLALLEGRRAAAVELRAEMGAGLPRWVAADPVRLRQVLVNLVSNALDQTTSGEVVVAAGYRGDRLWFEVRDTGPGIAPADLERIFEPFARGDRASAHGSGLGLAIARELVTLLGGELEVESAVGAGATFRFDVPLEAVPPPDSSEGRVADWATWRAPGDPAVLVAEDNRVNATVARRLLEAFGCRVTVVETGAAAVAAVAEGGFALVLLDCQMPELDGYQATERIRALPGPAAGVPVVAVTAYASSEDRERALAVGMDDYLAKPIEPEGLRTTVERWLPAEPRGA